MQFENTQKTKHFRAVIQPSLSFCDAGAPNYMLYINTLLNKRKNRWSSLCFVYPLTLATPEPPKKGANSLIYYLPDDSFSNHRQMNSSRGMLLDYDELDHSR